MPMAINIITRNLSLSRAFILKTCCARERLRGFLPLWPDKETDATFLFLVLRCFILSLYRFLHWIRGYNSRIVLGISIAMHSTSLEDAFTKIPR